VLRPLKESDFEELYAAGSDPLIWEQHPERERFKRENFTRYFQSGIDSGGALATVERSSGRIIGSSRFTGFIASEATVEVGYTFVAREFWGNGHNTEMKRLMLDHAFGHVNNVHFYIGEQNFRSRRAIEKIGAKLLRSEQRNPLQGAAYTSIIYEMAATAWRDRNGSGTSFIQDRLETERMALEPIVEGHAEEMWWLFSDTELHRFVPYEPLSLEKQRERCVRWAQRRSPDGKEIWLNWAGRDKKSGDVIAHFQVEIKSGEDCASIGYLVARHFHHQGYATEGLSKVIEFLKRQLQIREVKAWSDTRNVASHALARKLGMIQTEMIKDTDFFKGKSSDEYVFSCSFEGL